MDNRDTNQPEDRHRAESIVKAIDWSYTKWVFFRLNLRLYRRSMRKKWSETFQWFDVNHMGFLLVILAIIVILGGALLQYNDSVSIRQLAVDLWANFGTELISIAITVLIIDALNRRRDKQTEERQEKRRLMRELKSELPTVALRAIEEMSVNGWTSDGTLAETNLSGANLSGAKLSWADLKGSYLTEANLKGADLRWAYLMGAKLQRAQLQGANLLDAHLEGADLVGAQLQGANLEMANLLGADIRHANLEGARLYRTNFQATSLVETNLTRTNVVEGELLYACTLKEAIMPDGSRYDGRLSLEGDIEWAQLNGHDPNKPEEMAKWYEVPIEQYLEGQEWYRQNHDRLLSQWDYVVQHHGPKKDLPGYCSPSPAVREIIERFQKGELKRERRIRGIDIDADIFLPPIPPANTRNDRSGN